MGGGIPSGAAVSYHQFSLKLVTARKRHKCAYCGQRIEQGDQYQREKSVYDGEFQDHAWHLECLEAQNDAARDGDTEFLLYSNERPEPIEVQP